MQLLGIIKNDGYFRHKSLVQCVYLNKYLIPTKAEKFTFRSVRSSRIACCVKLKYTRIFQKTTGFWKKTFYELLKCASRFFGEGKSIFWARSQGW